MDFEVVDVTPRDHSVIIGQAHFIKTVEDLYETLVTSSPAARFGIAFCESSGPALIRVEGNDDSLRADAASVAARIGAGHSFVITLRDAYPINVLNRVKSVEEVTTVFCATANPVQVIVASTEQGRGIMGVIDGVSPKGTEGAGDAKDRRDFLRKIGYKR
ncbi:MAG TPA: adenosine-specific kinase [Conexivisphaerales archaeon]|nr:adenosine-specific kinase [Conexivisphaerales archaeon]